MLYGASGELPLPFLDELSNKKISLLIHRRNLADPYVFTPKTEYPSKHYSLRGLQQGYKKVSYAM